MKFIQRAARRFIPATICELQRLASTTLGLEESVVASNVPVATVTKAKTKKFRMKSFRMASPICFRGSIARPAVARDRLS
jgi:hypothetical protein